MGILSKLNFELCGAAFGEKPQESMMDNPIFQQSEQFFKPMTDMMALNARTFEALAEKQTGLMSEMWNDGVNYARGLSEKRDVESFYSSQKEFWDKVNQKVSSTAKDSYALLTEAQEKMSGLMQDSIGSVDTSGFGDAFAKTADAAQESTKAATQAANQAAAQTAGKAGQARSGSKSGTSRP
jgi:hypothetical protein